MPVHTFLRTIELKYGVLLAIILSIAATILIPGNYDKTEAAELSLAVTGILFGLVVGFYFSDLWDRWRAIRDAVAVETASIIGLTDCARFMSSSVNKDWQKNYRKHLIDYLKEFFKIEWGDNAPKADEAFSDLGKSLTQVKLKTNEEIESWQPLVSMYLTAAESRDKSNILSKDKLNLGEWIVLFILGSALLLALFYLKTNELSSMLFTALLTSATLILFFVIRDLNSLTVQEADVTFEPYLRIYEALDEKRHYWRKDVEEGRIKPLKDEEYVLYD